MNFRIPTHVEEGIDDAVEALQSGWGLPYSWMDDASLLEFEIDSIFEGSWQAVGLARDLISPGDRILDQVGRIPVVVVLGRDSQIRAFANVCRHRGYPVVHEDSGKRTLQCRYHAWTYGLDGCLINAPGSDAGLDKAQLGLRTLGVQVWRGVVFVSGNAEESSLQDTYPGIEGVAQEYELDLGSYEHHSRLVTEVMCDWKLFYDNVLECYHCGTMHQSTLNTRYDDKSFKKCGWVGPIRRGRTHVKGIDSPGEESHRTIQLFPGTILLQDPVIGQLCRFAPSGPRRTRMTVDYLYNPDADPSTVDEFVGLWNETFAEDRDIVALQQHSIGSGAVDRARLLDESEESVLGVQALILEAYRRGAAVGGVDDVGFRVMGGTSAP